MGVRASNRERRIMALFNVGLPPSEIDRRMNLVDGVAHSVIVTMWAYDKEMGTRGMIEQNLYEYGKWGGTC